MSSVVVSGYNQYIQGFLVGADDFIARLQPDALAKTVLTRLKRWQGAHAA